MNKSKLLVSQIRTPDGTVLRSNHVHDYVTHIDANGETYMLDGGTEYQKVSVNTISYENISIYEDSPYEEIRKYYCRGGRGKNGNQPLKWVPLCEMSNSWLENCIKYNKKIRLDNHISTCLYNKELDYRNKIGIIINDDFN